MIDDQLFDEFNTPEIKVEEKPTDKPSKEEPIPGYVIEAHDIDNLKVAKWFGLDVNELYLYQDKLDTIMKWAQGETKSQNITDIMLRVKSLQRELGTDPAGRPFDEIYKFVVLDNDEKQIQKEKQLLK